VAPPSLKENYRQGLNDHSKVWTLVVELHEVVTDFKIMTLSFFHTLLLTK
ncbi:hypothetical protein S83_039174, partial [Arachis hypogaea]